MVGECPVNSFFATATVNSRSSFSKMTSGISLRLPRGIRIWGRDGDLNQNASFPMNSAGSLHMSAAGAVLPLYHASRHTDILPIPRGRRHGLSRGLMYNVLYVRGTNTLATALDYLMIPHA